VTGFTRRSGIRKTLLALTPAALASDLPGQDNPHQDSFPVPGVKDAPARLPNGKLQRDEILKADYDQNLKDARELVELTRAFELDLEKSDRFVLSLGLLKKLDDIEKITRRIRGRMKK